MMTFTTAPAVGRGQDHRQDRSELPPDLRPRQAAHRRGRAGTIQLDGDTATGRAYLSELARGRDGSSHLNYFVYHDRYQRTPEGWRFSERVSEFRYLDSSPPTGSPPAAAGAPDRITGE
jgi:hypothetical protein